MWWILSFMLLGAVIGGIGVLAFAIGLEWYARSVDEPQ